MSIEIERRFLLKNNDWQNEISQSIKMQQGYMSVEKECTIRVRIIDNHAWITIKGFISNISRHEFEYPIPVKDAQTMLKELCAFSIQKTRHIIHKGDYTFEIDEYEGENAPLVIAELELKDETEDYPPPNWLGEEITADGRYSNAYLSRHHYSLWENYD